MQEKTERGKFILYSAQLFKNPREFLATFRVIRTVTNMTRAREKKKRKKEIRRGLRS